MQASNPRFFSSDTARELFRDVMNAVKGEKACFIDFTTLDELSDEFIFSNPPKDRAWKITGIDHIAIPLPKELMKPMTRAFELLGAEMFHDEPDTNPEDVSSMWLRGIVWDGVRIAFIVPHNRQEISQVQVGLDIHGIGVQHVAIAIRNIEAFVEYLQETGIFRLLSPLHERADIFGPIKQVFAAPLDERWRADEGFFFEFVERPA